MQRLTTRPGLVSLKVKPNWFASKWLAGICIAWFLLVSGATAQTKAPSPEPQVAATQATDAQAASQSQSASDIQNLLERLQRQEDIVLEMRHANVDWWLAVIGSLIALLGFGGILFPYLMGYTHRASLKSELEEARRMVASIERHEQKAAHVSDQMQNYSSETKRTPDEQKSLEKEAQSLQENQQASESDKLRARAVLASQEGDQSVDQAQQAYDLWQALTVLQPRDASAQFNAGYWAQELFEQKAEPSSAYWLQKLKQHYGIVVEIKPDFHEALYNWGTVLAVEARALAGQDLVKARELWQEAGSKYSKALKIKPSLHEALNNWGNALAAEAWALKAQQPENKAEIEGLLTRAQEMLEKPGVSGDVQGQAQCAYNLACVYAMQGKVEECMQQLKIVQKAQTLPSKSHLEQDIGLDDVRGSDIFQKWWSSL